MSSILFNPPDRRTYVAKNTVSGADMYIEEQIMLENVLNLAQNENFEIVYSNKSWNPELQIQDNIIVGLTNMRIFKLERGHVSITYYDKIKSVGLMKNGPFRWDKIVCTLKSNTEKVEDIETFGIYYKDACEYIYYHMQQYIS